MEGRESGNKNVMTDGFFFFLRLPERKERERQPAAYAMASPENEARERVRKMERTERQPPRECV
jgi:hypothetical protein